MARYQVAGRTIVITGSAGDLGSSVAAILRDRGANLALLDIDGDRVRQQAADLGSERVARGWVADVRDLAGMQEVMDAAAAHFGRIDVVLANAGIGSMAAMETLSPEIWERVIDVNLSGVWRTFRAALPHVREQRGYLVATSSMAAFMHSPLNGPYVASKAGVWALCDATRTEVRHLGVDVGSIHPTFFAGSMMDDTVADEAGRTLWGGNEGGLWAVIPREDVAAAVVDGIEHRRRMIVVPRRNAFFARIPGLIGPLFDRVGFRGSTVPDAIARANETGWITHTHGGGYT